MEGHSIWSHHGIICTGESYKGREADFAKGALCRSVRSFNASLEGNTRPHRHAEGESVDATAFKAGSRSGCG